MINKNSILEIMNNHRGQSTTYNIYDGTNKVGSIRCQYDKILFSSSEFNKELEVINQYDGTISLWSDFSPKRDSLGRASPNVCGAYVSIEHFMLDVKENLPYHFEWIVWNLP